MQKRAWEILVGSSPVFGVMTDNSGGEVTCEGDVSELGRERPAQPGRVTEITTICHVCNAKARPTKYYTFTNVIPSGVSGN